VPPRGDDATGQVIEPGGDDATGEVTEPGGAGAAGAVAGMAVRFPRTARSCLKLRYT
jgi:hypothetical protein